MRKRKSERKEQEKEYKKYEILTNKQNTITRKKKMKTKTKKNTINAKNTRKPNCEKDTRKTKTRTTINKRCGDETLTRTNKEIKPNETERHKQKTQNEDEKRN